MFENEKLMVGEHFTYEGIEWICLDVIDGNYLAITAKVWQELPFDIDNKNNWKESSLRRVLNDEFLDKFLKGLRLAIKDGYGSDWFSNTARLDCGMIDGEAADVIVQMALFGEVMYG